MLLTRLIAAAAGFALPVVLAATATAAPHRPHPAHVRTATYKVAMHKASAHRHALHDTRHVAQLHRHTIMRGS